MTAELSGTSADDVTVYFTISGTASQEDYTLAGNSISIAAGETTQTIVFTPNDDELSEGSENVVITMRYIPPYADKGENAVHTVIIADNETRGWIINEIYAFRHRRGCQWRWNC